MLITRLAAQLRCYVPERTAAGRLAGGLGGAAEQPGARHPVPVSDHPRAQPAGPPKARAACAAALLRWLHVVVTQRVAWNPAIAAGQKRPTDLAA